MEKKMENETDTGVICGYRYPELRVLPAAEDGKRRMLAAVQTLLERRNFYRSLFA